MNSFFEIIRGGINTTFQDNGRNNLYHIGIPFSGVMDKRNYALANSLVGIRLISQLLNLRIKVRLLNIMVTRLV